MRLAHKPACSGKSFAALSGNAENCPHVVQNFLTTWTCTSGYLAFVNAHLRYKIEVMKDDMKIEQETLGKCESRLAPYQEE